MRRIVPVALVALTLSACASERMRAPARSQASATLVNASGQPRGTAAITVIPSGLRIVVAAIAMLPGIYAAHVHAIGKCDAPDFMSAGGHWNPAMRQHGKDNPMGAHAGDLPNLVVGTDGTGRVSFDISGVGLDGVSGLLDADGAAVMIHQKADDYRTDPTGNAGGRQACGVIVLDERVRR